jgi:hypothetical protein
MRLRMFTLLTLLLGATLLTAACGSSTSPSSLASITITGVAPAAGGVTQLTATGVLSDGTTQDVTSSATWTSSDTTVVTVSSTGAATGVAAGTASVFATVGVVTGTLQLNVTAGQ